MKHWNWILPLTVAAAIVLVIYCFVIPSREQDIEFEMNRKLIELKVDKELLEKSNKQLSTKIDVLAIEADSLQRLIQKDSTEILTLIKSRHEKMDAITNYSDDELYRFFSGFKTDTAANQ